MTDRAALYDQITAQIEPFNKKGVALSEATTFAGDLEWDSLTVMDFVAAIEDEFDIVITMATSVVYTILSVRYAASIFSREDVLVDEGGGPRGGKKRARRGR